MIFTVPPKNAIFILISLITSLNLAAQQKKNSTSAEISRDQIKVYVDYLASDSLLGRNTPSRGQDSAAAYIARIFRKDGLLPFQNTYYQTVPLSTTALGKENSVEINQNGRLTQLKIKSQFVPYEMTASGAASGEVVFAGYGITAPEYQYDDYAGLDVKGKIVILMRHEPGESDSASVFNGVKNTAYGFLEYKVKNAIDHGAAGILVLTDPLNHQMISPRGFPWPSLSAIIPDNALPMHLPDPAAGKIPVVHVGKEVMNIFFGGVDSLKAIQSRIDKSLHPASCPFPSISVRINTTIDEQPIKAYNIAGFIPGSDPVLKDEFIIIGAHYDHVGFLKNHQPGEDYIINGADDNASGTAGMMAVADAFAKMKIKPKRSILFIAFTAEEKGLFGSKAYVDQPAVPLNKSMAMLNLDMVGRNHIDTLYLVEGKESPDITEIVKKENAKIGFTLVNDEELSGRSDYDNFYKKDIPFAFFFSGLHNDYHTVRDNPDTINPDKIAKVAQLVFKTALYLANDHKTYTIIKRK